MSPIPVLRKGLVPYTNDRGEVGIQDTAGNGYSYTLQYPFTNDKYNWVQVTHPERDIWVSDQARQRASYLGTKRHLVPFLVPHRFEGKKPPSELNRSKLGYAIGLNSSYLQEIFGHLRQATAHYSWGTLGGTEDQNITDGPKDPGAKRFWDDATGDGVSWSAFIIERVLEWMCSSPGGFVIVDSNMPAGTTLTKSQAEAQGIRATLKWVPFSCLEDFGYGPRGYTWMKFGEAKDVRKPRMEQGDTGIEIYHIIYTLQADGSTSIQRFDDDGKPQGAPIVQTIKDMDNVGILPIVPVKFGQHPDVKVAGAGLLIDLADIVIDLFNLVTEIREAYRDAVFSFLAYKGASGDEVQAQFELGTRLVNLGDDPHTELNRVAADSNEVESGLRLLETGLQNWALSAKRKSMEVNKTSSNTSGVAQRTGNSLKAEFQLDLVPLMISLAETLDKVETEIMFVFAQMEGLSPEDADKLGVTREKDFQMEDEASRIARLATEFLQSIPGMPKTLLEKLIMKWADSLEFLNLDEKVDGGGTLRDQIEKEAAEVAKNDQDARTLQNKIGIMGSAAVGGALGGNRGGGGSAGGKNQNRRPGTPPRPPKPAPPATQGR